VEGWVSVQRQGVEESVFVRLQVEAGLAFAIPQQVEAGLVVAVSTMGGKQREEDN